jgi:hypothetical protein
VPDGETDSTVIDIDILCSQAPYITCKGDCADDIRGFVAQLWGHLERLMNFT